MKKTISLLLLLVVGHLKAQLPTDYRDDDTYQKLVYHNIRENMRSGIVKGIHQLQQESKSIAHTQPISIRNRNHSTSQSIAPDAIYTKLKNSVFAIWKYYRPTVKNIEGIAISATAFAISDDGILATNTHVLETVISDKPLYEMDSCYFVSDYDGNVFSIDQILKYDNNADILIFKIRNDHHINITPISLAKDIHIGANVYTLSHPKEYPFYFSSGIVARKSLYKKYGTGGARIDITADYAIGSSGGPVVNEHGELVSIISTTNAIKPSYDNTPQMTVKETIPTPYLLDLLKK